MDVLTSEKLAKCRLFSCGDTDLDDFFHNDVDNYHAQLLGKSYCYCLDDNPQVVVCAFTLSNSSLDVRHLPNSRRKKLMSNIPHEKRLSSYPAVLIGRLGVSKDFAGKGVGSELLDFIKSIVILPDNRYACRFLTVDAYNNPITRKYYENNNFQYLFSTEQQEKEFIGMNAEQELKTRLMYYDLILLSG